MLFSAVVFSAVVFSAVVFSAVVFSAVVFSAVVFSVMLFPSMLYRALLFITHCVWFQCIRERFGEKEKNYSSGRSGKSDKDLSFARTRADAVGRAVLFCGDEGCVDKLPCPTSLTGLVAVPNPRLQGGDPSSSS